MVNRRYLGLELVVRRLLLRVHLSGEVNPHGDALSSRPRSSDKRTLALGPTWAAFPHSPGLWEFSGLLQFEGHRRLQEEGQVKEFKGKILKSGEKFRARGIIQRQLRHLSAG